MEATKENPQERHSPGGQENRSAESTAGSFSHTANQRNGNGNSYGGTNTPDLLTFAREAVRLGFSALPTVPLAKYPRLPTWKPYQTRLPTPQELERWFTPAQEGIGVVCGKVSGGGDVSDAEAPDLEALDFDTHDALDVFRELAERAGLGGLVNRIIAGYLDASPSGNHLPYYCTTLSGNLKLAKIYVRDEAGTIQLDEKGKPHIKTLVETKGEGGFIVIPPSHGGTHKSGKPYTQVCGGLASIVTISPAERQSLLDIARGMNEVVEASSTEKRQQTKRKESGGTRPGDLYNAQAPWDEVLTPHGWTPVFERNGVGYWRRPGKEDGISATTCHAGTDYLYVFSTSTAFESERGYSKFSAYTLLNHNGDFTKAADDLLRQGYFPRGDGAEAGKHAEPEQERRGGAEESAKTSRSARPAIRITTNITGVVDAAEHTLLALPHGPHLFQRIDALCFISHTKRAPKWLVRESGAPTIVACSPAQLRERMSRAADWFKWVARSETWVPALPPAWAVETLHDRRDWNFSVLTDVVSSPTLWEDGEIIRTPGYDQGTGLLLDTQGVLFPPIPEQPTLDEARRAVTALTEPFADFPFAGEDGKSAALSAILSLVARPAIDGCVPLFAVDSTTRGTGKGLLIDVVSTIATGRFAPRWAQSPDGEEDRKRLLTIAIAGDACVHIDNLTHPLGTGPLDSAITSRVIKDRLLGLNRVVEAPFNCVLFASGNNISYATDMPRRVVPIHLESLEEHPENRTNFTHERLLVWVRQERPRLVVDALTILRAYFVAGCPKQGIAALGSFEEWSDLVRSALIWAGCPDPCEGRKTLEAEADPGYENLARLLHCWDACYGSQAVTLASVIGDVGQRSAEIIRNEWNELGAALAAFDPRFDGKRLDVLRTGHALRAVKGRVIGGKRLLQVGSHNRAILWAVQQVR